MHTVPTSMSALICLMYIDVKLNIWFHAQPKDQKINFVLLMKTTPLGKPLLRLQFGSTGLNCYKYSCKYTDSLGAHNSSLYEWAQFNG